MLYESGSHTRQQAEYLGGQVPRSNTNPSESLCSRNNEFSPDLHSPYEKQVIEVHGSHRLLKHDAYASISIYAAFVVVLICIQVVF
jgi:hypothetical protein